ncbi:MAG: hypothetical protein J0G99_00640 [Alphaproteobacteria bacterium]|nr:hypothetical protein [Alphaproteobacteria bacterium]
MRRILKTTAVVVALAAGGCVQGQGGYYGDPYGSGYYADDAYGYCDAYGCPADYWNQPVYYGPIYFNNAWLDGPFYYRDWGGARQYWVHGGWHNDNWRGPRPDRYREGRYGPALGRDFYRSNHVYRQGGRDGDRNRRDGSGGRDRNYRDRDNQGQNYQGRSNRSGGYGTSNNTGGRAYPPGSPANVPPAERGHMSFEDRKAAARDEGLSAGGVRPPGYDENGKRRH